VIRSHRDIREVDSPAVTEQLTSTEKLLVRYENTRDWVQSNTRIVSLAAVVLVAIVIGLWYWASQRKVNEEHAATYLSRAVIYYFQGDYRHSVDGNRQQKYNGDPIYGLRYIADQFGSTPSGKQADLYLGNAYYALGKYDSASRAFNDASSNDPLIEASIEAGRAAIFEHRSNKIEAAKLFERAAKQDETNPLDADYELAAARDYEGVNQKDDAVRLYRKLVADFPSSQFDDAAKHELRKMNVEL
jgi:tetratricopeptide (TPR) repeat protein